MAFNMAMASPFGAAGCDKEEWITVLSSPDFVGALGSPLAAHPRARGVLGPGAAAVQVWAELGAAGSDLDLCAIFGG